MKTEFIYRFEKLGFLMLQRPRTIRAKPIFAAHLVTPHFRFSDDAITFFPDEQLVGGVQ